MNIPVTHIKPHIGSVIDIKREQLLEDALIDKCRELLEERGVVVFPRIGLTDAEQLAFTDRLGPRVNFTSNLANGDDTDPDIYKVTLDPKLNLTPEYVQGTFFWHMDGLNSNIPPPKATLLSARRVAAKGGQTEFASTYAAYKFLPDAVKAEIDGLRAVHNVGAYMRYINDSPSEADLKRWSAHLVKEHPIVWTRSSGRKSLIIGYSAERVVGMPFTEGKALLARLLEWTAQPDFHYQHQWELGDFVVWNNTGTLHRAIPYDRASGRMMHRTSIAGTEETA